MVRALVLYHSLFGNTMSVAMSLANGFIENGVETDCKGIGEVDIRTIPSYDLIAIGGPTHILKTSKEMKAFLSEIEELNLKGKMAFSFDTRNESRMNKKSLGLLENSAAKRIEGAMKRMKLRIVYPRESALVNGQEGPLESGVEERFTEIGRAIAVDIKT